MPGERQRAGDAFFQRAGHEAVERRAVGGFEVGDLFVDGLMQDRVVAQPEQAQGGVVGLDDSTFEVGGDHPVGDGPEGDGQPFGFRGERAAGLAAFGHVAVHEDRLPVVGIDARRRRGERGGRGGVGVGVVLERFGGRLQPAPGAILGAQPERAHERDAGDDALAEFLHDPGHVVGVDEGGEILSEQFLRAVAEDFEVVGADVSVKTVLGNLANQVEGALGDEPIAPLATRGLVARLAQGTVLGGEGAVLGLEAFEFGEEFVVGQRGGKVHGWAGKHREGNVHAVRANLREGGVRVKNSPVKREVGQAENAECRM